MNNNWCNKSVYKALFEMFYESFLWNIFHVLTVPWLMNRISVFVFITIRLQFTFGESFLFQKNGSVFYFFY